MDNKNKKRLAEPLAAKHRARKRIIQALYQIHFNETSAAEVIEQFVEEQDFAKVDMDFFQQSLITIEKEKDSLTEQIEPHLGREKSGLGAIEYAILLLATHELNAHIQTPFKVVINEAILLAQEFGGEGSHSFVNGVLFQVSKQSRALEMEAEQ